MFIASTASAAELRVFANVDASRDIYAGENFTYQVIIDGYDQPGQVDLSPLASFNPRGAGGSNASQTSISIINGRTTQTVVRRYVMNYVLTAGQAGPIRIPSLTVTVDGKTYQTNPVELNVVKPGTTDHLEIEVTLSQQQCYVGQPVILTVKFYVYADVGDYQFAIPALTSDAFFVEDLDSPRQSRISRKNREAILLSFSKVLMPKRTGDLDLGTPSVSADVAVGRNRSSDSIFDDFFRSNVQYKRFLVSSQPLKLSVLPLPQQDVPEGFYGLVGQYTISASANPIQVSVGDPITLTIKIGGDYLKPVQWPDLEKIPALADNFKIPSQKASPTLENGFKVFTQTIRSLNDKVTEIPAIGLIYFDSQTGRYEIAKTEPVKLEVAPTKILTAADVEGRDFTPAGSQIEQVKKGLSANYEGFDCLQDVGFSLVWAAIRPVYLASWAIPLVVLIASVITKKFVHQTPQQAAQRRKRRAARDAAGQLKKITSAQPQHRYEILADAMKQYIGRRFDKVAGSLTAEDCRQAIIAGAGDSELANRDGDIISDCEAARYAPVESKVDSATIDEVIGLIYKIEKKSKL